MAKNYEANIVETSKELSVKEKIKMKDLSNAINLDTLTQEQDGSVIVNLDYYVKLRIHNEKSKERPDYDNIVIVDKDGSKYYTGSSSFIQNLEEIYDEMTAAGETDITIEIYRKPSKNYNGKEFITCSVV